MSLAPEIRRRIFGFLLVPDDPITVANGRLSWPDRNHVIRNPKQEDLLERFPPRISVSHSEMTFCFLICRQLYSELVHMYYGKNTFIFATFDTLHEFLKGIRSERRKHVGSVVIYDDSSYQRTKKKAHEISASKGLQFLGESHHLRRLEIQFEEYQGAPGYPEYDSETGQVIVHPRFSGRIAERLDDMQIGDWQYSRSRQLQELAGLNVLKAFRGLGEVVVKERRTGEDLREENQLYAAVLMSLLIRPKILEEHERPEDVRALQIVKFNKKKGRDMEVKPKQIESERKMKLRETSKALAQKQKQMDTLRKEQEEKYNQHKAWEIRRAATRKGDEIVTINGKEQYIDKNPHIITPRKAAMLEKSKRKPLEQIETPNSKRQRGEMEEWRAKLKDATAAEMKLRMKENEDGYDSDQEQQFWEQRQEEALEEARRTGMEAPPEVFTRPGPASDSYRQWYVPLSRLLTVCV